MNIKNFFENITSFFKNYNLKTPRVIEGIPISPNQASLIPLSNAEFTEELKEIDKFFLSTLKISIPDAQDILDAGYKPTSKVQKIIANDLLVKFATQFLGLDYSHINTLNTSVSQEFNNKNIDDTINKIKFFGDNNLLLPETLSYFFNKNFGDNFLDKKYGYKGLDSYSILNFFISTSDVLSQNNNDKKGIENTDNFSTPDNLNIDLELLKEMKRRKDFEPNDFNNDEFKSLSESELKAHYLKANKPHSDKILAFLKSKHIDSRLGRDLEIILSTPTSEPKPFQSYYTNSGESTHYRKDIFEKSFSDDNISHIFIDTLINELIKSNKVTPQEIFNKSLYNNTAIATNILSKYNKDIINSLTNEQIEHITLYFKSRIVNEPFFNYLSTIQKEVHSNLKNVMINKLHKENYEQAIIDYDFIKISSSLHLPKNIKTQLTNIQTKINDLENSQLNKENKHFIKNIKNEIINTLINYNSVQELDKNFNKNEISSIISQYEFSITSLQQEKITEQLKDFQTNNNKYKVKI